MRTLSITCGLLGLTGVLLGAFGAHGLKEILLAHGSAQTWETAVIYHLVHSAALPGLISWRAHRIQKRSRGFDWLRWAGWCWVTGVVLFSGSLYALALGGPRILGPITPLGGLGLLVGWLCVVIFAAKQDAAAPMGE